jgi:hypothetical protein
MLLDSDLLYIDIKKILLRALKTGTIDIKRIKNLIASNNFSLFEKFQECLNRYNESEKKSLFFDPIYREIARRFKKERKIDAYEISTSSEVELKKRLIEKILQTFVLQKFCSECRSTEISSSRYAFNENKITFFCSNCQKNVNIFHNIDLLPLFLVFIYHWSNREIIRNSPSKKQEEDFFEENFLNYIFSSSFKFFRKEANLELMLLFYDILNKIGFEINNIKEKFGDINDLIFHEIKNSLKSNNYLKIKHSLEHIIKMDSIPEISGFFRNPQFNYMFEGMFNF